MVGPVDDMCVAIRESSGISEFFKTKEVGRQTSVNGVSE
jgi:hypothetical protein